MFALEAVFARLPLAKVSFAARIGDNLTVGLMVAAGFLASRNQYDADLFLDVIVVARRWSRRKNRILMVDTSRRVVLVAWFNCGLRLHDIAHDAGSQNNRAKIATKMPR